jgi:hypothetical protein
MSGRDKGGTVSDRELDVTPLMGTLDITQAWLVELGDAVDNASDQDRVTWLTDHGKRVAAIVPVDLAENWPGLVTS